MDDGNPVFLLDKGEGSRKMRRSIRAQTTIEYLIILLIVLACILATNFIGRVSGAFEVYFDKAVEELVSG